MRKLILLMLLALPVMIKAAYLENIPSQVTQPDGTILNLLASGDEFANRLHDANGYTIIQSKTDGFYYYAMKNGDDIMPSAYRYGTVNPAAKNIVPGLNISAAEYKRRVSRFKEHLNPEARTPQTGTVNNVCIFIRFADQTEFTQPRSAFEEKFNAVGENVYSQRSYFQKASYNQLNIVTSMYPNSLPDVNVSYQDSHPRSYFMPYNQVTNPDGYSDEDERAIREQTMLADAVTAVAAQIPPTLNVDADNDSYVDNVCFVIRGPHTAWADLLWAHRWFLYYGNAVINGKQVGDYTFQPENQNEAYIICHEMFHSIGAPDLYHYDFNGVSPVGNWDLMESGKGHMGAYMKKEYGGWLPNPSVISQTGTYTLNPVTSNTNCFYRINATGITNEYFILEYRKKGSDFFERNLPESGLLIYRINITQNGNAEGPPDEVYIYRPNGTNTVNGDIANAGFSLDNGRTEFNDFTNPNCKLTYGQLAHLNISNIGISGETLSFHYNASATELPPVISNVYPQEGDVLVPGTYNFTATLTTHGSNIASVDFILDGTNVHTSILAPYSYNWTATQAEAGNHTLMVTAHTVSGLTANHLIRFRVVNPLEQTWFNWTTANPVYSAFGRGSLPIQVAIDLDLGTEDYVVKGLALNVDDDPYGDPAVPGLVSVKINRFADGAITETTLLNLGDVIIPLNQHYEMAVTDTTVLSGEIALIVNLYEYQNIVFDNNGVTGHTWITEPDRPWTDAQARGMLGAADIGLKLQAPNVHNEENVFPVPLAKLSCYPNPFRDEVSIKYELQSSTDVSLAVYNLKGQKVRTLFQGKQSKGSHTLAWDGKNTEGKYIGNGIYLVRLCDSKGVNSIRKIVLSR